MNARLRLRRALILLAASLVVTILIVLARSGIALGLFANFHTHFSGSCRQVGGIAGVRDMVLDPVDRLIFVSAGSGPNSRDIGGRDGIYSLPLDRLVQPRAEMLNGTTLRPGSLSLFRGQDGSMSLMVLDDTPTRAVDIFDVRVTKGVASLTLRSRVTGGLLDSATGLAASGSDSFYATTDRARRGVVNRVLEDAALMPGSSVVYFDGSLLRMVASGIERAGGLALSNDGAHLYVAARAGRSIRTYERAPVAGSLKEVSKFAIPSGPERVTVDQSDRLWIGAQPRQLEMSTVGESRQEALQVFVTAVRGGIPTSAGEVYAGSGIGPVAAISVARMGAHLFIAGFARPALLDCVMQ